MRLYQVKIVTDDFKRAFSFYSRILGMNLVWGDIDGPPSTRERNANRMNSR